MRKTTYLFFAAFLCGVLAANLLGIASGKEFGVMSGYFVNRYLYTDIKGRELFLYLFYERFPKLLLLVFLNAGIYGAILCNLCFCSIGFSVGFLAVVSIMNYGIKGIALIFGFFFPQWILYFLVLGILYAGKTYAKKRTSLAAIAAGGFFFAAGLLLESYVNPFLLRRIIRIL